LRTNRPAAAPSSPDPEAPPQRPPRGPLGWIVHVAYGTWSLALLALLMTAAALVALLLPSLAWRRASTRMLARLWLALAFIRLQVAGLERLPEGSCVLIANHSSYLDGVVMKAALPPRFSFVIKREASAMPVVGLLLRRIGSEFVDRHSAGGRQRDARRVVKRAEEGHSLVFFPEGTFDSIVGLKRFHIGAFVAASRGGLPLAVSVILGARSLLPNRVLVPRPGVVRIEVLALLEGAMREPDELRDAARALMLQRLGEPDLTARPAAVHAAQPARADEPA
jgi:1-acyl-sn-glycerol-3-phosphate acyltransferase